MIDCGCQPNYSIKKETWVVVGRRKAASRILYFSVINNSQFSIFLYTLNVFVGLI